MNKLKVLQVSWASKYSSHIYSKLFFSPIEAEDFKNERIAEGALNVKLSEVTDIWEFTARNFSEKIATVIELRLCDNGAFDMWKNDLAFEDEINELAEAAHLRDFQCECWKVFSSSGLEVFALSCVWTFRGELHHYVDTLEVY